MQAENTATTGEELSGSFRDRMHALVDWSAEKLGWVPLTLIVGLPIASAVCFAFTGFAELALHDRITLAIVAGGLLLLSGVIGALREKSRRNADHTRVREAANVLTTIGDAVIPTLAHLGVEVSMPSTHRDRPFDAVVKEVLVGVQLLFPDINDVRVVVYRHDGARGRRKQRLEVETCQGRRKDKPQPFVIGDGGRGDAVFTWLATGRPKFVADTHLQTDEGWKGSGRGYRTFIAAPIIANKVILGMLTIDAPNPGDLDETDEPMVELLAALLAVGYAAKR